MEDDGAVDEPGRDPGMDGPERDPEAGEPERAFEVDEPDPVILPIEDALDLHPFAPRDIPSVVDEYLHAAAERGFREVRLIHGRGKGVQRAIVQRLLAAHALVDGFVDAPAERGGWGATVVRLRGR